HDFTFVEHFHIALHYARVPFWNQRYLLYTHLSRTFTSASRKSKSVHPDGRLGGAIGFSRSRAYRYHSISRATILHSCRVSSILLAYPQCCVPALSQPVKRLRVNRFSILHTRHKASIEQRHGCLSVRYEVCRIGTLGNDPHRLKHRVTQLAGY